jgi:hypothetical protein
MAQDAVLPLAAARAPVQYEYPCFTDRRFVAGGDQRSTLTLRRSTMPNSYNPNFMQLAEDLQIEILESHVPDSRLHAIINNPVTEGIDEG